jgi:hypothetical protein
LTFVPLSIMRNMIAGQIAPATCAMDMSRLRPKRSQSRPLPRAPMVSTMPAADPIVSAKIRPSVGLPEATDTR